MMSSLRFIRTINPIGFHHHQQLFQKRVVLVTGRCGTDLKSGNISMSAAAIGTTITERRMSTKPHQEQLQPIGPSICRHRCRESQSVIRTTLPLSSSSFILPVLTSLTLNRPVSSSSAAASAAGPTRCLVSTSSYFPSMVQLPTFRFFSDGGKSTTTTAATSRNVLSDESTNNDGTRGTATMTFVGTTVDDNDDDGSSTTKQQQGHHQQPPLEHGDPSLYKVPIIVRMPDMSTSDDTHNSIAEWYKQPGDVVRFNDVICDITTPDFTFGMVIEDEEDGIMGIIHVQEGMNVPDNTPICTIFHFGTPEPSIEDEEMEDSDTEDLDDEEKVVALESVVDDDDDDDDDDDEDEYNNVDKNTTTTDKK
jgi:hypothetical protein